MSKSSPNFRPQGVAVNFADSVTGSLNQLLRQQLDNSFVPLPAQTDTLGDLLDTTLSAVSEILHLSLDKISLDTKLEQLFEQQQAIYTQASISECLRKRQYIGRHGLVMSPDHCITTQKDSLRVRAFIRAANNAISNLRMQKAETVHIVYPACGPFAPLLLPLISYYQQKGLYSEQDIQVTLIDMQPGAVASLNVLVKKLKITPYIRSIKPIDGCDYESSAPVDLVILEAMQHGFSREGHLALARHFAKIMEPDGIFIPQEVHLRAVINEGQKEYNEQWQGKSGQVFETNMSPETLDQRIELGDILKLTPDNLRNLKEQQVDEFNSLIECNTVEIPKLPEEMQHPLLLICTRVITDEFEDSQEIIGEYDSGITHPLPDMQVCINFTPSEPKPGDLLVNSGDKLKFYYRLNGLPGFLATKA